MFVIRYRWAEAAERAAVTRNHASSSLPRENRRKEPLGQANNSTSPLPSIHDANGELIVIRNEPGPLEFTWCQIMIGWEKIVVCWCKESNQAAVSIGMAV